MPTNAGKALGILEDFVGHVLLSAYAASVVDDIGGFLVHAMQDWIHIQEFTVPDHWSFADESSRTPAICLPPPAELGYVDWRRVVADGLMMVPVETEESLIEMARAGDRQALERLLLTHTPAVWRHIDRRFLPSLQGIVSADDILQETLLQAFLGIDGFQQTSPASFCAWLKAIADMRLLDALKAQRRQKRGGKLNRVQGTSDDRTSWAVDLIEQLPGDASTGSRRMIRHEAIMAIHVGMAGLPDDQREAIRLHLLEGKSLEETSDALHRSTSAVRSLIHRGKRNLSEVLGRASLWLSST